MNKFIKCLKATILCIRFPFLYPRNRFTGKHYNCWSILRFHRKWWKHTEYNFKLIITKEQHNLTSYHEIDDIRYSIKVDDNKLKICDMYYHTLAKYPISRFGSGTIIRVGWKDNDPCLIVGEDWEDSPNINRFIKVVHAKWLQRFIKVLDWINDYPLQLFHCIPSYTELNAMDIGWRKAFGIQMCKEIRSALLKNGWRNLFNYRIMQIKEKYGELCWYDLYTTEEIQKVIRKYENISRHTCIDCGAPATKRSTGWIYPFCDNCIGDREYVVIDD